MIIVSMSRVVSDIRNSSLSEAAKSKIIGKFHDLVLRRRCGMLPETYLYFKEKLKLAEQKEQVEQEENA